MGRYIGIGLLILFSPVLLVAAWTVLVATPVDVAIGLREAFSSRDVVQVADGFDTMVAIAFLLVVLGGVGLLLRLSVVVAACGLRLAAALPDRGRARGRCGVRAGRPADQPRLRMLHFPRHQHGSR